ncbi:diacylglycerol/lipid kinase family protein [Lacisediminihabitans changchengi]|uniref:Diacylglycerol kinase n=1 Tax=Lacisediminihabitans changchengi TaxID=2787634 RepID=A0A934W2K6_9MICO|nr:diacylglycerol kinase family protein [Lacisediminihabitans changchengi]MBK4346921.1 diacylglycerol kinase [Lacisediminihabitans changchengi]MBK4347956.1 diacylglycerol kinase [Lacisediminihabitans changchengi]
MTENRAAVVYNPTKVDIDALRAAVAREETSAGWAETLWFETSADDPGAGQTAQAIEQGATVVIAAGGDGTVRYVAQQLHGSPAALALLPAGTGNLLARNLQLTLSDLDHSVRTAFRGVDKRIDLAWASIERADGSRSRHAYLVMAGFGLDAKMLAGTDEQAKKRLGWIAYVGALGRALLDKNELRMRYQLDGSGTKSLQAHTMIVGNVGTLRANVLLLPEAKVDDGLFEIVFFRPEGIIGWVEILWKVIWENGVLRRTPLGKRLIGPDVNALRYVKGKDLKVRLGRPEEVELDGDPFGEAVAFHTWIDSDGIRTRVPAEDQ